MVVNYAQRPFRSRRSIWERPVHLRLRVLLAEPSELDPLGLTLSAAIPGLLAGTIHIEPPVQRLLFGAELAGNRGLRRAGVDRQLLPSEPACQEV
jgi:hypothetical protein